MDGGGVALLSNLLGVVLAPVLLHSLAHGQFLSFLPGTLKTQSRICLADHDCNSAGDMVCWRLYDGCDTGICMCDPRTHVTHPSGGRCVRVRRVNEPCDGLNDTCSEMLACINGTCQCPFSQNLAPGSMCIHPNSKPLGFPCNPSIDVCYHQSVYGLADREVECSRRKICQCKEGYKQDDRTCRRLYIWESGCKRDYDCEGGAVCVDQQCACPTGYKSVAGNTKCAKIGATLELPLTARCDEINERRYCSRGLVCHRCRPNEAIHICARYLPGFEVDKSALHSTSFIFSSQHQPTIIILSFCLYNIVVIR